MLAVPVLFSNIYQNVVQMLLRGDEGGRGWGEKFGKLSCLFNKMYKQNNQTNMMQAV